MKYKNIEARKTWEIQHKKYNPSSNQLYYPWDEVAKRQENVENRINKYREQGLRLKKSMRSYLNSKKRKDG